jgi:uncharacterized membrane protein YcaP (DUF421 family)
MELDWKNILFNDLHWGLAGEVMVRTLIMFTLILLFLRFSGKKGVRQLSLFEVAIIIGLGSAAGDPMFNQDSAIGPAVIVFVSILIFYRLLTYLASKSEWFERVLEGSPVYIIEEGKFMINNSSEPMFAKDEFFAEMRQQSIEHLGQVKTAILETNGEISFFYYPDEEVKPGLPVLPKIYNQKSVSCKPPGKYACTYCGQVDELLEEKNECPRCHKDEWVAAISTVRIT